jgi:hypothetical protein
MRYQSRAVSLALSLNSSKVKTCFVSVRGMD